LPGFGVKITIDGTGCTRKVYRTLYSWPGQEEATYMSTTVNLTDLRDKLSDVLDEIGATGAEFVITRHGRPVAVLLGHDEYESLIETLNILSDPDAVAAIEEGDAEFRDREAGGVEA
jgi:prevent-host-death family protein